MRAFMASCLAFSAAHRHRLLPVDVRIQWSLSVPLARFCAVGFRQLGVERMALPVRAFLPLSHRSSR